MEPRGDGPIASRGSVEPEGLLDVGRSQVARVAAEAARDSSVKASFLGGYPDALLGCARTGRRLDKTELVAAEDLGRKAADRNVDLASLLDLYLSTTWRLWQAIEFRAGAVTPEAVGVAATAMFRAADDTVEALARGYQGAQRLAIRREESLRREFVDGLLTGLAGEDLLGERARRFGFNLAGAHLAVVARTDRPLEDAGPVHRRVESQVLASSGGRDVVVATRDGSLVCIFPATVADPASAVLGILKETEEGSWRVGVGRPYPGPGGIVRSYAEAHRAIELADRLGRTSPVARFDALLPYAILGQEHTGTTEMVENVLGPLRSARGGSRPLLETLEAYLDESLNSSAAARRLHLSQRAVAYRLERISNLTGYSPKRPEHRFVLEIALRAAQLHGFE